jgi:uncharacterized membrane protein YdbT with pleckstrin-like domain
MTIQCQSRTAETAQAETELWRGEYSARAMIPTWIGLGLPSILFFGTTLWVARATGVRGWWWLYLGAILVAWSYVGMTFFHRRRGIRYRLTNRWLYLESGAYLRRTDCLLLADVYQISLRQNVAQRLLGVGTLVVLSRDISHPKLFVRGIARVEEARRMLEEVRAGDRG